METQLLMLVDRAGQSGFGHRTTSFYQSHLCVKLYLNDHKVCNCVFTYWTRRNWRDEFLVPGFKLVNFNDWFLDFNWFLFHWNGDFFLWKSNETDTIKKNESDSQETENSSAILVQRECCEVWSWPGSCLATNDPILRLRFGLFSPGSPGSVFTQWACKQTPAAKLSA